MFTKQAAQIGTALHQGGVDAAIAKQVESLLGQCRERIEHRGPVDLNYTPPRTITPEIGSHVLPGMRPFQKFQHPKRKKKQPAPTTPTTFIPKEHRRDENPPNDEGPGDGPDGENVNDNPDYEGGAFIKVNNDSRSIGLRTSNVFSRHCTFPMSPGGQIGHINGIVFTPESKVTTEVDTLGLDIVERNRDTLFRLNANIESIDVITSVAIDGTNLVFSRKNCWVFKPTVTDSILIPLTECPTP